METNFNEFLSKECVEYIAISAIKTAALVRKNDSLSEVLYFIDSRFNTYTPTIVTGHTKLYLTFRSCYRYEKRLSTGIGFRLLVTKEGRLSEMF